MFKTCSNLPIHIIIRSRTMEDTTIEHWVRRYKLTKILCFGVLGANCWVSGFSAVWLADKMSYGNICCRSRLFAGYCLHVVCQQWCLQAEKSGARTCAFVHMTVSAYWRGYMVFSCCVVKGLNCEWQQVCVRLCMCQQKECIRVHDSFSEKWHFYTLYNTQCWIQCLINLHMSVQPRFVIVQISVV